MINKVILLGNLGKDPEVRHLESGSVVAKFPLATNESYRDRNGEWQQITDWHNVVMWGNAAERAEKYLKVGNTIFVEGKIRTRKWQDNSGNDRYTTEIIVLNYKLVDKKENSEQNFTNENNSNTGSVDNTNKGNDVPNNDQVDDLPF